MMSMQSCIPIWETRLQTLFASSLLSEHNLWLKTIAKSPSTKSPLSLALMPFIFQPARSLKKYVKEIKGEIKIEGLFYTNISFFSKI